MAWSRRTPRVRIEGRECGGVVHRWPGPSALEREGGGGGGDVAWSRRTLRVRIESREGDGVVDRWPKASALERRVMEVVVTWHSPVGPSTVEIGRRESGGVVQRWPGPSALEREGGGGGGDVAWSRRTLRVRMGRWEGGRVERR
ncbi:MAG: hypothetical protein QOE33_3609 [Acidobacteriota bacterium]|nr:hypothetical protein [Acidobacteriota bacterium]